MQMLQVCYNLKYNGWTRQWHSEHKVPYAYHGIQWIGYDDTESFQVKIDYIKSKGLGGGMVWSLDQDDFSNSCGDGAYPLMNLLRSELFGSAVVSPLLSSTYPSTNVLTSSLSPRGSTTRETGSSSSNYHVSTDSQLSSKRTTQSRTVSGDIFSTTISSICGAPKQCENGRFYEDSCDIRKYYQCSSGVAWHYECAAGTVWDKRIQNCNWDYLVLTSSAPCGCGPPSNCIHGNFYEDKCDMKLYYQCAHGIPYPYECHPGTLWDITITNCNWENAVPSRTTPSGSDCSSYRTTHLPDQQTTVPSTQTQTQMSKTTPQYTEHSTFDSTNRDSSTMKASTSSNTHTQSVDQTTVKPHTTETHTTSQSYTSVTPVSIGQLNTLQSSTFTKQPMVSSTFFIPSSSKSETRINEQSTTSPPFATTGAAVSHSRQQITSFRVITNDWTQQATTPSIIETTSPTMSKYQHQTTADLTPLQTHQNAATSPSVATTDGTRTNHPQTSMLPNVAVTNGTT
ncbi:probable endochitinase, partial [Saccostrea cucullata]|uniref:probable endochitinase n=1 Tax=Saccostrea cuccullata TaxID=36930 RepID=UPI002ED4AB1B